MTEEKQEHYMHSVLGPDWSQNPENVDWDYLISKYGKERVNAAKAGNCLRCGEVITK